MNVARFVGGPLAGQTLGVAQWPPPELLAQDGGVYERIRMSDLSDEQMETLGAHLVRGAEYRWSALCPRCGGPAHAARRTVITDPADALWNDRIERECEGRILGRMAEK